MEDRTLMPPKSSTAPRKPYTVRWTIEVSAALDKEVARRRENPQQFNVVWDRATVSEDILRQALGVGTE
jgi:hypothetical protein